MFVSQRRNGVVPRAQLASIKIVDCRKHLETGINSLVLTFDSALAFHVGLAKREINVEVGIRSRKNRRNGKPQTEKQAHKMRDFHLYTPWGVQELPTSYKYIIRSCSLNEKRQNPL